jgi:hypothetical protein
MRGQDRCPALCYPRGMEINQLKRQLKDLEERVVSLRGFL